jgi:hypothetical protein
MTSIEESVLEAIRALNAANRNTNAGQVASVTKLSRQRVVVAATALRHQGKIKDVGKGNAYNWRVIEAKGALVGEILDGAVTIDDRAIKELATEAWATHPNNPERERRAVVKVQSLPHAGAARLLHRVGVYLPSNYMAQWSANGNDIEIVGHDNAGWTLDGYVIPRLASGLITATEV